MSLTSKRIGRAAAAILAAVLGIWLFSAILLPLTLPFMIGLLVAAAAEGPTVFLKKQTGIPYGLAAFLCVLFIFALLFFGAFLLCRTVLSELSGFLRMLPQLAGSLTEPMQRIELWLCRFASRLPDGIGTGLRSGIKNLFQSGDLLGAKLYDALFSFASGLLEKTPGILLFTVTAVVSSFMTAAELPSIRSWMKAHLPEQWREKGNALRSRLRQTLGKWLKAQMKLLGITFLILTAGLLLLRTDYPLLFALLITLVDALPVLGTGTVLIPWGLLCFLQGNVARGVGFLVLYGVAALMRQVLEPRLVGRQMGLDPLLTLLAIYVGFRIFGVWGMILLPIAAILLKQFFDKNALSEG